MCARQVINAKGKVRPYRRKSGEPYMSLRMREHFRSVLTYYKSTIMSSSDVTIGHMKSERVHYADEVDLAAQEEMFRLELRERDRERKLLKNIEASIDALDDGEYGYCEVCGVEIGLKRLEARPTARMCFECKTVNEIKERRGERNF